MKLSKSFIDSMDLMNKKNRLKLMHLCSKNNLKYNYIQCLIRDNHEKLVKYLEKPLKEISKDLNIKKVFIRKTNS